MQSGKNPGSLIEASKADYATNNQSISKDDRPIIFHIYEQYELWKKKVGGYDLMDVVNYINMYLYQTPYSGPTIHYLMVD